MTPFQAMRIGNAGLDQQVVTAGSSGIIPDRFRGYSASIPIGSIVDGTSNIYGGAAITELYHEETNDAVHLRITGAVNSGWTRMEIVGQLNLLRASASSFAGNEWVWIGVGGNPFGGAGTVRTVKWY